MKIPKVLHFIWLGGAMPERYMRFRDRWIALHPTWDIITSDASTPPPPEGCCHTRQQSNWMRLQILRERGGVYVDCDTEPLKNIEPLLAEHEACASPFHFVAKTQTATVCNSFLAATPNHPWIVECCELLAKERPDVHLSMGSKLASVALRNHPEVTVLPRGAILQWPFWEQLHRKPPPGCYAIHHFDNMKRPRDKWGS